MNTEDVLGYSALFNFSLMCYALVTHNWLAAISGFVGLCAAIVGFSALPKEKP